MGTDIKTFIEIRTETGWIPAQKIVPKEEDWGTHYVIADEDRVKIGQNHVLFALLAGIRNKQGLTPIARPRGLPPDVSVYVRKKWQDDADGCMCHSATHFLVSELLAYDWNVQRVSEEGFVAQEEFDRLALAHFKVRPKSWRYSPEPAFNEYVAWTEPVGELVKEFTETFLPALARFGEADALRLVLWFD